MLVEAIRPFSKFSTLVWTNEITAFAVMRIPPLSYETYFRNFSWCPQEHARRRRTSAVPARTLFVWFGTYRSLLLCCFALRHSRYVIWYNFSLAFCKPPFRAILQGMCSCKLHWAKRGICACVFPSVGFALNQLYICQQFYWVFQAVASF